MADPTEIAALDAKIAEIEDVLDAGATETVVAGEKVRYDLDHLARRLVELKRQRAKLENPSAEPRSPFTTIDMSGAF